jgi:hypothetical protein
MQSYHPTEHSSDETTEALIHTASVVSGADYSAKEDLALPVNETTRFYSQFTDSMELHADVNTVSAYFDRHHEWFRRCAQPMTVEPIGKNSYALVIGKFGSFGYEVEPKIGLDLLPQDAGVYRIETVSLPEDGTLGYTVDFRASMELVDLSHECVSDSATTAGLTATGLTKVQWLLDLTVDIQFPRFIHALPKSLIQKTGDRLLHQVVRQVSGRLTHKVLEDFHHAHGLVLPKRSKRWFFHRSETNQELGSLGDICSPGE